MLRKRGRFWHYQFEIDGQTYWGSTRQTTKSKAETVEAQRKVEVRNGTLVPGIDRPPTLNDFAPRFLKYNQARLESKSIDRDTARCYANGWRLLAETDLRRVRLDRITVAHVSTTQFPGGPSNANQALRTLRRMLSLAVEVGILRAAPRLKLRREHGREQTIERWMEALLLECAPSPLREALTVMLDCGMRPEEVMRMRWEHLAWEQSAILVPHGKSLRAQRHLPMSKRVREALSAILRENEWIFPANRSSSGHRESLAKQWRSTVAAANRLAVERGLGQIPDGLVLYAARHTFATRFLEAGGNVAALMKLMGHSSLTVTQKYLHAETASARAIIDRANEKAALRTQPNPDIYPDIEPLEGWVN